MGISERGDVEEREDKLGGKEGLASLYRSF